VDVLRASKKHDEAAALLAELKERKYRGKPYPYLGDMAYELLTARRYKEAESTFRMFADEPGYEPALQEQALIEADEIWRLRSGRLDARSEYEDVAEGNIWRNEAVLRSGLFGGWRVGAYGNWDDISLNERITGVEAYSSRWEAGALATKLLGNRLTATALLGSTNQEVRYGAAVAYSDDTDFNAFLELSGNEKAEDSLLLEAIDGRQTRVELTAESPVASRFRVNAAVHAREAHVQDESLGRGYGADLDFAWHFRKRNPNVAIAYFAEYSQFDFADAAGRFAERLEGIPLVRAARDLVLERLIQPYVNRHGVQLRGRGKLGKAFVYTFFGEIAYRFEEESWEYGAGAGFIYRLARRLNLNGGLEYFSGGQGVNVAGEVIFARLGMSLLF